MINIPNGVYIGENIEIVVTDRYEIAFRRAPKNAFLESVLVKADLEDEKRLRKCIGICRTEPATEPTSIKSVKWSYKFLDGGNVLYKDSEILDEAANDAFFIKNSEAGAYIFKFFDGAEYEASQHESFAEQQLNPECLPVSQSTIGECLLNWNMGLGEILHTEDGVEKFFGITINTKRHMYIFKMSPDHIYCRAARYYVCDKGIVFNQNFRQSAWASESGGMAYMVCDNRIAMQDLVIDEALFDSAKCTWDGMSVYWSVFSVDDDLILLNGCEGDIYRWERPIVK